MMIDKVRLVGGCFIWRLFPSVYAAMNPSPEWEINQVKALESYLSLWAFVRVDRFRPLDNRYFRKV